MNRSYKLSGTLNAYPIKAKYFKDTNKALKYLDKILTDYNVQIEDVFTTEGVMTTYVANNYSRFTLTKIA